MYLLWEIRNMILFRSDYEPVVWYKYSFIKVSFTFAWFADCMFRHIESEKEIKDFSILKNFSKPNYNPGN